MKMISLAILATLLCFCVGLSVLFANRKRSSNQAFAIFSFLLSIWTTSIIIATIAGMTGPERGLSSVRNLLVLNGFISSYGIWALWLLQISIIQQNKNIIETIISSRLVFLFSLLVSFITLGDSFAKATSGPALHRGALYVLHNSLIGVSFLCFFFITVRRIAFHSGIQRLELQYLALTCSLSLVLLSLLNGAGNLTGLRALNRASILVVVAGYLFMAWALAYHRIFNARQVLSTLAHRGLVLAALVGSTWGLSHLLQTLLPETAAWVGSTVACGLGAIWLNERTRPLLGLDHERSLAELRGEIIRLSQGAGDADQLRRQCEATVSRHFRVEQATILSLQGGHFAGEGIRIPRDRAGFSALLTLGWITPESLQRRRPSAAHQDLAAILAANRLSAAVAIPRGSPDPSVIIALGTRADNWPVTYPEITRLQNVAELIDGILTRTRLTDQIALQNRLEHLAMMSRALAHDLKNLITPVNAFLVHTEDRFPAGSEAAQVHSSARRSIGTITDYVREALFFAENLRPCSEPVDLAELLARVRDTTAERAKELGVDLATDVSGRPVLRGDAILLERMLVNLVNNAVDASGLGKRVQVRAMTGHRGRVQLQVIDEGVGINPEDRARIFDPYFTTKRHGREIRGFGLGLTIVQKIASLHGGAVTVESTPGQGATFTVDLSAEPPAASHAAPVVPVPT